MKWKGEGCINSSRRKCSVEDRMGSEEGGGGQGVRIVERGAGAVNRERDEDNWNVLTRSSKQH